jgi:hypothetical protein
MPIFIVCNDGSVGHEIHAKNVHAFVQHEIFHLTITLSERMPGESFTLSYLFGHVRILHFLQLRKGSPVELDIFFQIWYRQMKQSKIAVIDLSLFGPMEWDIHCTQWINRIMMEQTLEGLPLKRLTFRPSVEHFDISGLDLPFLQELCIPVPSDPIAYSLAQAMNDSCTWKSLIIGQLDLNAMSQDIWEIFMLRFSRLSTLRSLKVQIIDSTTSKLQLLASSFPPTLDKLIIHTTTKAYHELVQISEALTQVKSLEIRILKLSSSSRVPSIDFVNWLDLMLGYGRNLKHLTISNYGTSISPSEAQSLWNLLASWSTLEYVNIDFLKRVEQSCADSICLMLQNNTQLTHLQLGNFKWPSQFSRQTDHYLTLNRFKFLSHLVQEKIDLSLWPYILQKASNKPSVLFEILQQKHDLLLSRV